MPGVRGVKQWRLFKFLKHCYDDVKERIYYNRRKPYFKELFALIPDDTSIISSNCFAGRIMQDKGMQYNTPTLGLYFWSEDYIEFLQHLEYYLKEAKIEFVEHSKHQLGDERRKAWKHWYPIGMLGGKVEIHFLHYHTEKEAAEKWYRRAKRVNLDKLLVIGMEQNLCTEQDIINFDALPFENKYFFSTKDIVNSSNIYVPEFFQLGEIGNPYQRGNVLYKHLIEKIKQNRNI